MSLTTIRLTEGGRNPMKQELNGSLQSALDLNMIGLAANLLNAAHLESPVTFAAGSKGGMAQTLSVIDRSTRETLMNVHFDIEGSRSKLSKIVAPSGDGSTAIVMEGAQLGRLSQMLGHTLQTLATTPLDGETTRVMVGQQIEVARHENGAKGVAPTSRVASLAMQSAKT